MPQSLSRVFVHITFSTKKRLPLIDAELRPELFKYLAGICNQLECRAVEVGGIDNHVHICCLLSRKIAQSDFLRILKSNSSKWVRERDVRYSQFYWQEGYGIFSVNPTEVPVVVEYIKNQEKHLETRSVQDEFRLFLKKYGVEYDEKYVWD